MSIDILKIDIKCLFIYNDRKEDDNVEGKLRNRLFDLLKQRELELGRSISQAELAREINVSPSVIRRWLNNEVTRFDARMVEGLCRVLDCQVGDLLYIEAAENDAA